MNSGLDANYYIRDFRVSLLNVAFATDMENAEAAQFLLRRGADPNQRGAGSEPDFFNSVQCAAALKLCLEKGANLGLKDGHGRNVLDQAIKYQAGKNVLELLLSSPGLELTIEERLRVVGAALRVYGDGSPEAKLVETVVRK